MEKKDKQNSNDQKNWLEWLVFGVSLFLLVGILGYLLYQTIQHKPGEPDIYAEAMADPSELAPNRYLVSIFNKGGATAEEVVIEFKLYKSGAEKEKSELSVAFVPKDSESKGWITFSGKLETTDSVATRVISYKKP
ncbi:hypothetical protein [Pontibacter fetidus]|uniref:hypothetical protein n=1 Tax=Pontibacter fetidus TaxID=2700082 RepID=UPI00293BB83F|nr:hypothetical protein [Pontibacter fetidus]